MQDTGKGKTSRFFYQSSRRETDDVSFSGTSIASSKTSAASVAGSGRHPFSKFIGRFRKTDHVDETREGEAQTGTEQNSEERRLDIKRFLEGDDAGRTPMTDDESDRGSSHRAGLVWEKAVEDGVFAGSRDRWERRRQKSRRYSSTSLHSQASTSAISRASLGERRRRWGKDQEERGVGSERMEGDTTIKESRKSSKIPTWRGFKDKVSRLWRKGDDDPIYDSDSDFQFRPNGRNFDPEWPPRSGRRIGMTHAEETQDTSPPTPNAEPRNHGGSIASVGSYESSTRPVFDVSKLKGKRTRSPPPRIHPSHENLDEDAVTVLTGRDSQGADDRSSVAGRVLSIPRSNTPSESATSLPLSGYRERWRPRIRARVKADVYTADAEEYEALNASHRGSGVKVEETRNAEPSTETPHLNFMDGAGAETISNPAAEAPVLPEETIEQRVARLKRRVAELTGDIDNRNHTATTAEEVPKERSSTQSTHIPDSAPADTVSNAPSGMTGEPEDSARRLVARDKRGVDEVSSIPLSRTPDGGSRPPTPSLRPDHSKTEQTRITQGDTLIEADLTTAEPHQTGSGTEDADSLYNLSLPPPSPSIIRPATPKVNPAQPELSPTASIRTVHSEKAAETVTNPETIRPATPLSTVSNGSSIASRGSVDRFTRLNLSGNGALRAFAGFLGRSAKASVSGAFGGAINKGKGFHVWSHWRNQPHDLGYRLGRRYAIGRG